jgi:hypothetical protein
VAELSVAASDGKAADSETSTAAAGQAAVSLRSAGVQPLENLVPSGLFYRLG